MTFTAPLQTDSIKIMLLGSGELGKEVAIEAQRLGIEVIAVDKYENAPAHLVANHAHVIDFQDSLFLCNYGCVSGRMRSREKSYYYASALIT